MLRFALGFNTHAVPHTGNSVKTLLMGLSTTKSCTLQPKILCILEHKGDVFTC